MTTLLQVKTALPMDGSNTSIDHAAIVIEDTRIKDILTWEEASQAYPDAVVDSRPDMYAMPGMIDAHVHLCFSASKTPLKDILEDKDDPERMMIRMIQNCQESLKAGVTTVRDCGAASYGVFKIRDAVRSGWLLGCDVISSGLPLTTTGGHTWYCNLEVEGLTNIKRCCRQLLKDGADFLKMMLSGGNMTPGSSSKILQYDLEETSAFAHEARIHNKMTAVHVHSTESIRIAVEAGVSTLEHASFLGPDGTPDYDAALVDKIIEKGIFVSPAFNAYFRAPIESFPVEEQAFRRKFNVMRMDVTKKLLQQGVKFAASTDAGCNSTRFADFALCLGILHDKLDMTTMQTLESATRVAADCCGVLKDKGTLEKGKVADIILMKENPLKNLLATTDVHAVYKSGKLAVDNKLLLI